MSKNDSLGDRMKGYEIVSNNCFPNKHHIIIRVDGKAFHTLTRGMNKPFDFHLIECMKETAKQLLKEIQNAKLVYVQSDEISIYMSDTDSIETQPWFGNKMNKIVSLSASIATATFNKHLNLPNKTGLFDSRAFIIPKIEIANYFIWRQQDWIRNSIQMLARGSYSQKELHKKNTIEMKGMVDWDGLRVDLKYGTFFYYDGDGIIKELSLKLLYDDYEEFIS